MKKLIFFPLLLLVLIVISINSFGAAAKTVYTFVGDANWVTNGHWSQNGTSSCGCAPDESKDDIFVKHDGIANKDLTFGSGASLTLQNSSNYDITGDVQLSSGSGLFIENGSTLTITGNVTFKNGATLNIQGGGILIVIGDVTNENNSTDLTIDGSLDITGNLTGQNGSEISGSGVITTTGTITTVGTGSIFGGTGSCETGPCITSAATPLPIQLLWFTASVSKEKTIEIKWATASEKNNDFFTVERSINGLTFEEIAEEPGAGNSSTELVYSIYDQYPVSGNGYYRLKQTDFDGKFEVFNIIAVNFVKNKDGSCVFKIYPNPCFGNCNLSLTECQENENATIQLEIIDVAGNKVISEVPYRNSDGSFNYHINTSNNLAPGVYIVKTSSVKEQYSKQLIVK